MDVGFPLTLTETESVGSATRFKIRAPDGRVVAEGILEAGLPVGPFAEHLILGVAASQAVAAMQGVTVGLGPPHAQFPSESGLAS